MSWVCMTWEATYMNGVRIYMGHIHVWIRPIPKVLNRDPQPIMCHAVEVSHTFPTSPDVRIGVVIHQVNTYIGEDGWPWMPTDIAEQIR